MTPPLFATFYKTLTVPSPPPVGLFSYHPPNPGVPEQEVCLTSTMSTSSMVGGSRLCVDGKSRAHTQDFIVPRGATCKLISKLHVATWTRCRCWHKAGRNSIWFDGIECCTRVGLLQYDRWWIFNLNLKHFTGIVLLLWHNKGKLWFCLNFKQPNKNKPVPAR